MQIINVGIDIEEVKRIGRLKEPVLNRVFTAAELSYCRSKKNPGQHLAARFAAKEAVFKAIDFDELALKKIEVIKNKNNKPEILLHDKRAKNILFKVSLTHTKNYAAAFVVAYKK
ncbi:MAG: holo-ACP synthase [Elusimicrobiota bacterium]|jgi:holo-[acyl-carrier protein] synthase|nr:holo-ACP synthase [Elusimicrobiota bacterium]